MKFNYVEELLTESSYEKLLTTSEGRRERDSSSPCQFGRLQSNNASGEQQTDTWFQYIFPDRLQVQQILKQLPHHLI